MPYDFEELQFCGRVNGVAEEEFAAIFSSDGGGQDMVKQIWNEYVAAGKPRNAKAWIRKRLEGVFLSVKDPPVWIEQRPKWPWLNGKPMVFLGQFRLEHSPVAESHAVYGGTLYLFGARVPHQENNGWTMVFRVVDQYDDLAWVPSGRN